MVSFNKCTNNQLNPIYQPNYQKGVGLTLSYSNYSLNSEIDQKQKKSYGYFLLDQIKQRERIKAEEAKRRQEIERKEEERLKRERREIDQRILQEECLRLAYLEKHFMTKEDKKNKYLNDILRYKRAHYQFFKRYLTYEQNVYEKIREMQFFENSIFHKELIEEFAKIQNKQYSDASMIYQSLAKAHSNNRLALSFKSDLLSEMKRLKDSVDLAQRKQLIYRDYLENSIQSQKEIGILKEKTNKKENNRYLNKDLMIPDALISNTIKTKMLNGLNEYSDEVNEEFDLERINEKNCERIKAINRIEDK